MKGCYNCGEIWTGTGQPGKSEVCSRCGAWLHCCLNCRLYDPTRHNKCISSTTEWVSDRAKNNFCDEFEFRERDSSIQPRKGAGRERWDVLWKGPDEKSPD